MEIQPPNPSGGVADVERRVEASDLATAGAEPENQESNSHSESDRHLDLLSFGC